MVLDLSLLSLVCVSGGEDLPVFCVSKVVGAKMVRFSGSEDTGTRGLALMIADTSMRKWSGLHPARAMPIELLCFYVSSCLDLCLQVLQNFKGQMLIFGIFMLNF